MPNYCPKCGCPSCLAKAMLEVVAHIKAREENPNA